jgi:hypothetical protein
MEADMLDWIFGHNDQGNQQKPQAPLTPAAKEKQKKDDFWQTMCELDDDESDK